MLIEWVNYIDKELGSSIRNKINNFNTSVKETVDNIEIEQTRVKSSSEISYDNTISGLNSDNIKEAIDEINTGISGIGFDQSLNTTDNVIFNTVNGRNLTTDGTKIDNINQELSTTSDVVFNSIISTTPFILREVISTITVNTDLSEETVVLANTTTSNITVKLPNAVQGQKYYIKKIVSLNDLIITTNDTALIEGNIDMTIENQNASVTLVSDGTNWYII